MGTRAKEKSLGELGLTIPGGGHVRVTGLAVDSRDVQPGFLFAALPGSRVHGAEYIETALRHGAGAVLTDPEGARRAASDLGTTPTIVVEDPRQSLAYAAALWFAAQPPTMVAVTGTNGKTSVASFTRQIWQALGHPAVSLGTMGVEGDFSTPLAHTTPEPITLHRILAEAAFAGVDHGAMEASSHGLDQRRLDGIHLSAAAFTNLTQDHLDYHGDMERYFAAKAGLFTRLLPEDGTAVVNLDDPRGAEVAAMADDRGCDLLTVGRSQEAALRIRALRYDAMGQDVRFSWNGTDAQVRLDLIGGFQAENAFAAAGLAIATGSDPADVFAVMHRLRAVRGRMQHAATRENGATVFVDYSHTPGALRTALRALRPHVLGRLVVVFGAGGDRDPGKRPMMGQAAADEADLIFVTDDNPRSEDPALIRAAVLAGCPGATEVGDRAEAILRGVDALEAGDTLLVAGKGHETGQTIGTDVFPFDDIEQASIAVAALDGQGV
ncbi:MAG: UDP-N-acetylmuramoyl-L-alanyl-D-glutamate--2,6-diaminopimelate ligase [Pseudomonadota bacterium]